MKMQISKTTQSRSVRAGVLTGAVCGVLAAGALVAGCGGGGDPLTNPGNVKNPTTTGGATLAFPYFEKCIFPIFLKQLPITQNGVTSTNTCAGAGCHDSNTGTGGALRVIVAATPIADADVKAAATDTATATTIRASDMYKNFYSAQGVTVFGSPIQSRLFDKPLLLNVLHGGGRIFTSQDDPDAKLIAYWISHPVPSGQDEFSTSSYSMFTPPLDPNNPGAWAGSTCNTQ
jgi:hypothetical protein